MRHPFDGIIHPDGVEPSGSGSETAAPAGDAERPSTRRSFLGALTAIVGGAAGLLASSEAFAQRGWVTTQALGERAGAAAPTRLDWADIRLRDTAAFRPATDGA
jgi:hypothetical protein